MSASDTRSPAAPPDGDATRADIVALPPAELRARLAAWGAPAYRAQQILDWLFGRWAASFEEMANLPRPVRTRLAESFRFPLLQEDDRREDPSRHTVKVAYALADGEEIESVWMRAGGRVTYCISSQAGCPLRCAFCATGAGGFRRNLTCGEILEQVRAMARTLGTPSNVVFMGMGEPLLNLDGVLPALAALADAERVGLSPRRITISTAGIPDGIARLAAHSVWPNLALSLNSPFEDQRAEIMPVTRSYALAEALRACGDYAARTGRRVSLEYVMLAGVNTGMAAADAVARIARGLGARVNLIAYNPSPDCAFGSPSTAEVARFRARLEAGGAGVTQRFRRGRRIGAGCGQLRRRPAGKSDPDGMDSQG